MENKVLIGEKRPVINDQLKQLFWWTQIAAIGCIIHITLFSQNALSDSNAFYFRLDLIVFYIGVVFTLPLYFILGKGKYSLAVTAFLLLWASVMLVIIWFGDGLFSSLILGFFISCYGVWLLGNIVKRSLSGVKHENQRMIESEAIIRKLDGSDALTGLLNRNGAEASYQKLLEQLDLSNECVIIYFIDLDNFKNINSLFDHYAGDDLLKIIGDRLSLLVSKNGFACRFGGDEFALAIRVKKNFDDESFAKNLLESIVQPHSILGTETEVTASMGIARVSDIKASFNSVCKKADIAMTRAKQSGKNSYHRYSDELHREYMRNLNIVSELKNAISHNLMELYFQPKINFQTGKVEGVEALLRWVRGNNDDIGPEEFIPIIESTELIHIMGDWVINEACISCKKWHDAGNKLKVAVNVSTFQLTRPSFYLGVVDALEKSQLPPEFLEIEITEHSLLQEVPLVNQQLALLKQLGVGLAIDDFGTGFSNMGYLTRLKIDVLKLDRSFISNLANSEDHRIIVNAMIQMAKVLRMIVVAEGIETETERDILIGLNCDYGQGFLWSAAVPASDLLGVIGELQARVGR